MSNQQLSHYDESQQDWSYNDGRTRVTMHHRQQSWQTPNAAMTMAPLSIHQAPTSLPGMQQQQHHHLLTGQQLHATAMAHHQSAIHHFTTANQNLTTNMASMLQASQPQSMYNQSTMPQPQISYSQTKSPRPVAPTQQRLALPQPQQEESSSSSSSSEEDEHSTDDEDTSEEETQLQTFAKQQAAQRQAIQQHYEADRRSIKRQGALMDDRIRRLEQQDARNRSEKEAKERELQQLRQQNAQLSQQQADDAGKHRQELADLARAQIPSPREVAPAYDMSALEKVIRDVQAKQLSKADIESVIEERVTSQLSGVAKKADIKNAGSQMQQALRQIPSGASPDQVAQAVNRELKNIVNDVSRRIPSESHSQRVEEAPSRATNFAISSRAVPSIVETPVTMSDRHPIAELPQAHPRELSTPRPKARKKQKAVAQVKVPQARSPEGGLSRLEPEASIELAKVEQTSFGLPLYAPIRLSHGDLPKAPFPTGASETGLVKVQKAKKGPRSILSARPSSSNALTKHGKMAETPMQPSTKQEGLSTHDIDPSDSIDRQSTFEPMEDFPDNASELSIWFGGRSKKPAKKAARSVQSSVRGTASKASGNAMTTRHSDTALPIADISEAGAMHPTWAMQSASVPKNASDNASQVSAWERTTSKKQTKKVKTILPGQGSTDTELAKQGTIAAAVPQSNMPLTIKNMSQTNVSQSISGVQTFALPENFPDNASQISAWERDRATRPQQGKGMKLGFLSPLRQVEFAQSEGGNGQELVRVGKDITKGKSKK